MLARLLGWVVTACIAVGLLTGLLIPAIATDPPGFVWALGILGYSVVIGLLCWSSHSWPPVEHRYASYRVDDQGIEIRQGVVWRRILRVQRSRVQHTDVSQGPLQRRFGLATLAIYTAGTEHAQVDLHGLDHGVALRIRDHLLAAGGDDAV